MTLKVTPINARVLNITGVREASRQDQWAAENQRKNRAFMRVVLIVLAAELAVCVVIYLAIKAGGWL